AEPRARGHLPAPPRGPPSCRQRSGRVFQMDRLGAAGAPTFDLWTTPYRPRELGARGVDAGHAARPLPSNGEGPLCARPLRTQAATMDGPPEVKGRRVPVEAHPPTSPLSPSVPASPTPVAPPCPPVPATGGHEQ